MTLFVLALAVLAAGAAASACAGRSRAANTLGPVFAVAGCLLGLAATLSWPWSETASAVLPWGLPFGAAAIGLDALTRLFLLPVFGLGAVCALSGRASLAHHGDEHNLGAHWFFFNLLLLAMALVLAARDAIFFLIAWELMSLAPFFLISFHDNEARVREASWIYLVAAHLGAIFCLLFFVLLWGGAGETGFAALAAAGAAGGPPAASALFILALIGFGAKAGIMPMHVWLPAAHPAAPSHVSAFLSGAMINAGIYGLVRALGFLGPAHAWWGWLLLGAGLASALLGVLQALGQSNLKRMLAYSSVENMGLVLIGLGAGLIGARSGDAWLAALGLLGAFTHLLNHSAFKGLLFLGAGEVLHATGTVRLDHLGGLQKRLPRTSVLFLIGAASIMALPPLTGFSGELLLYLGLAKGYAAHGLLEQIGLLGSFFALAAVGGLVFVCFAKAYGLAFLGEPRSGAAARAKEPALAALWPLAVPALACLLGGLGAPAVMSFARAAAALPLAQYPAVTAQAADAAGQAADILVRVALAGLALGVLAGLLLLLRAALLRGRSVRKFRTWDCGFVAPDARMQYSGSSFSEPVSAAIGPAIFATQTLEAPAGYFPRRASLSVTPRDLLETFFFAPAFELIRRLCDQAKVLQHGRIHLYILYILAVLVGLLLWKL
jgi:hydrogenase-4 component B